MLGTRVLSSIVILPPVIAAVWFGDYYFVALIALVGTVMAWEISGLAGLTATPARYAIATLGALTPIVAVELPWGFVIVWPVFAVAALLAISWGYLKDFAERLGFFTLSFLAFASLGSLIWLRFSDLGYHGAALVLYLVLVITATDVGAYFSGRWIGGAKLAPKISPNKTWAGLIGGAVLAALAGFVAAAVTSTPNPIYLAVIGAFLAPVAQIGDLIESWVKRRRGAKDSGNLIPGHGGILDRVDGYLTAGPMLTLMAILNKGGPFA